MISIKNLTLRFTESNFDTLHEVSLDFRVGELALVVGPTGSGKSSFFKSINGLAPHFTGGVKRGRITIDGLDITQSRPRDVAHLIGYVNQQAEDSLVAETVAQEIAFGLEQLGTPVSEMHGRVAAIADEVGLAGLLGRNLATLSGGQLQRVAIAAALASGAQLLLLDEPTSELDAPSADQIIKLLRKLSKRLGITVLVSEHRIDRLLPVADSVVVLDGRGGAQKYLTSEVGERLSKDGRIGSPMLDLAPKLTWSPAAVALCATELEVSFDSKRVLHVPKLQLHAGRVTGVLGANGSGKSTLFWCLTGVQRHRGKVELLGQSLDGKRLDEDKTLTPILVPQTATDLLVASSVAAELRDADKRAGVPEGSAKEILQSLVGGINPTLHPRDLSVGQQLALALAIQLVTKRDVILLDEPTRGLDYRAKKSLATMIDRLRDQGKAIAIASHDLDFIGAVADDCLVLDHGEIIQRGPVSSVLAKFGDFGREVLRIPPNTGRISEVSA